MQAHIEQEQNSSTLNSLNDDQCQDESLDIHTAFISKPESPRQPHVAASSASVDASSTGRAHSRMGSPDKPSYSDLQLRCQLLESVLERQQQSNQAALAATVAAHAAEEASLREYYEAQLCDLLDRLSDIHSNEVSACDVSAAANKITLPAIPDSASTEEMPRLQLDDPGASVHPVSTDTLDSRPASAAVRAARAGRSPSPSTGRRMKHAMAQAASPTATATGGADTRGSSAGSAALDDAALLRRELAAAEGLLQSSQDENRAAAKRIKDLETHLSALRTALAEESSRAQRAAASSAEAGQSRVTAAAERLSRILQLEGQISEMQATFSERERMLMQQLEAARKHRSAAENQAAADVGVGRAAAGTHADVQQVVELRRELTSQAEAHRAELTALRDKLQWYVEHHAMLTASGAQLADQAASITNLQAQLVATQQEAAGSSGTQQRIRELEGQVQHLQAALLQRDDVAPSAAEAAVQLAGAASPTALVAVQQHAAVVQAQLELQYRQNLAARQEECEGLRHQLDQQRIQLKASAASRGRVRELTDQLEQQQALFTRRVRTLEAKLAAVTTSSRRVSAASSGATSRGQAHPQHPGSGRRQSAQTAGCQGGQEPGVDDLQPNAMNKTHSASSHAEFPKDAAPLVDAAAAEGISGEAGSDTALGQLASSSVLRLREKQLTALTAQLQERTAQYFQLQQRHRSLEQQLKAHTAAAAGSGHEDTHTHNSHRTGHLVRGAAARNERSNRSRSASPRKRKSRSSTRSAAPDTRQQRPIDPSQQPSRDTAAAGSSPGALPLPDVRDTHSPGGLSSRETSPGAAGSPDAMPLGRVRHTLEGASGQGQVLRSGRVHVWPLHTALSGPEAVSSWPALCAELEQEVDTLRCQLKAREQELQRQAAALQAMPGAPAASAVNAVSAASGSGLMSLSALQLAAVAGEVAARETEKWATRVTTSEQALAESQAEASALRSDLEMTRARGTWWPGAAAFEALERKIAALEEAAAPAPAGSPSIQHGLQQQPQGMQEHLLQQQRLQFELILAAKNQELQGFKQQVEELLATARQLQDREGVCTTG